MDWNKKTPRTWYSRLSTSLLKLGLQASNSNISIFIKIVVEFTVYILIYVNDIIITCSQQLAINDLLLLLFEDFAIKDLGDHHFFLGINIVHETKGIIIS